MIDCKKKQEKRFIDREIIDGEKILVMINVPSFSLNYEASE